jgi:hypothetical protein
MKMTEEDATGPDSNASLAAVLGRWPPVRLNAQLAGAA